MNLVCAAGLFTTCVALLSFFQTKQFRAFRASLFACLGLWGIAPAMHALWLHGGHPEVRTYFLLDMCMGAVYLVRLTCVLAHPSCTALSAAVQHQCVDHLSPDLQLHTCCAAGSRNLCTARAREVEAWSF